MYCSGKAYAYQYTCKNLMFPSDEGVYKLGLVLLFRYGFCLSKSYLENPRKLLCYFWWRRLQIRVSVTVQVWFMPINKISFYLRWRRLQIRVSVTVQVWNAYVISDEGAYRLGVSVTVREWLISTNIPSETHVISYESAYKLGKKRLSLMEAFTN